MIVKTFLLNCLATFKPLATLKGIFYLKLFETQKQYFATKYVESSGILVKIIPLKINSKDLKETDPLFQKHWSIFEIENLFKKYLV